MPEQVIERRKNYLISEAFNCVLVGLFFVKLSTTSPVSQALFFIGVFIGAVFIVLAFVVLGFVWWALSHEGSLSKVEKFDEGFLNPIMLFSVAPTMILVELIEAGIGMSNKIPGSPFLLALTCILLIWFVFLYVIQFKLLKWNRKLLVLRLRALAVVASLFVILSIVMVLLVPYISPLSMQTHMIIIAVALLSISVALLLERHGNEKSQKS